MEIKEALEKHKNDCGRCSFKVCKMPDNATECLQETDIKAYEELLQYQAIGTVEQFREAMEKQKEKQYKVLKPCKSVNYYQCPVCNGLLHINENFCGNCGQSISWEENENE